MSEKDCHKDFKCDKCDSTFKSEKRYKNHISNELNPCDLVCIGCYKQLGSKPSWTRHKKECKLYKLIESEIKKRNSDEYKITNNVTAGSHNISTNNQINTHNNHLHNHNNMIMLTPFKVEHEYHMKDMNRLHEFIGPARDVVLKLIKAERCKEAYEELFKHIHGNLLKPQQHNVYMENFKENDIYTFGTNRFSERDPECVVESLNEIFNIEIKWLIRSANIESKEKQTLLGNAYDYYCSLDLKKDEHMRRLIYNNKDLVKKTIKKNFVVPNIDMIKWKNKTDNLVRGKRITIPD